MSQEPVLVATDLAMIYGGDLPVKALTGVSFAISQGERLAIVGPSGAGKSTLLNIVGLLDRPTHGSVTLLGRNTRGFSSRDLDRARARHLGFVFQESHVLGQRTVSENLGLALSVMSVPRGDRKELVAAALSRVGLSHRQHALARLLSGGEKQRLSVARACLGQPALLLADEPTGNLDDANASQVLGLLNEQAAAGAAMMVITHDSRIADWADRTIRLEAGTMVPGNRSDDPT